MIHSNFRKCGPAGSASCAEVPSQSRDPLPSHVETIQQPVQKVRFYKAVAKVAAALYQSKWSQFLSQCHQRDINPCKASLPQVAEFFFYLCCCHGLSVPAVKGYWVALNHVFSLTGTDLASNLVVSGMFCSFEKSCLALEVRPPDWNLSLGFWCLSWPPFEPLKLASDKHLTWKTSFLLALASAK